MRHGEREMPFVEHIRELRRLLIISICSVVLFSIVCFVFYDLVLQILFRPFEYVARENGSNALYVNTILEGFLNKIKICLLSGVMLSLPVHTYNLIHFVFPALKGKEKRVIIVALVGSFLLLVFASYYGYFKVIPTSIRFLTSAGFVPDQVGMLLNFGKNILYIFNFLLGTIILFQMPLLLEILMVMKVVKRAVVVRSAKYVVVGIFVLSALLTPPDLISQITLAAPMILLFLLSLVIARIFRFGED